MRIIAHTQDAERGDLITLAMDTHMAALIRSQHSDCCRTSMGPTISLMTYLKDTLPRRDRAEPLTLAIEALIASSRGSMRSNHLPFIEGDEIQAFIKETGMNVKSALAHMRERSARRCLDFTHGPSAALEHHPSCRAHQAWPENGKWGFAL